MIAAAPFFGEFGWEICMWIPWLRGHKRAGVEINVLCRTGHAPLYEDFADEILECEMPGITRYDCATVWVDGVRMTKQQYFALTRDKWRGVKKVLDPTSLPVRSGRKGLPLIPRDAKFHCYNDGNERRDLILFHRRRCIDKQPERDWHGREADHVAHALHEDYELVAVGHPMLSGDVLGAEDKRGCSMAELIDLMSRARMVVGPSSGPLHLANMCNTPVVWWSSNPKDQERYATAWNPFNCKNRCAEASWQPDPEKILEALHGLHRLADRDRPAQADAD